MARPDQLLDCVAPLYAGGRAVVLGATGSGAQHWSQSVLGLVVAADFAGLSVCGTVVVCRLPLHDLWRNHPKALPVAFSPRLGRMAPSSGRTLGRLVFGGSVCPDLFVGRIMGFAGHRLSLSLVTVADYGGGDDLFPVV